MNGSGSLPVLHLNTGIANGSRQFLFDGTQLRLKMWIWSVVQMVIFDDLKGDSVNFNRANFDFLDFGEQVTASYTADNDISIGDPDFEQYLCYPKWLPKNRFWKR